MKTIQLDASAVAILDRICKVRGIGRERCVLELARAELKLQRARKGSQSESLMFPGTGKAIAWALAEMAVCLVGLVAATGLIAWGSSGPRPSRRRRTVRHEHHHYHHRGS
jgi:hypothetical protein